MDYPESKTLRLDLGILIKGLDCPIYRLLVHPDEELNQWLMLDLIGKITVWTRKDLSRIKRQVLVDIHSIEVYLTDSYRPISSQINERKALGGVAYSKERDVYISLASNGMSLLVRNYKEHVNLRTIELNIKAFSFELSLKGEYIYTGGSKGVISMYDYNIGLEIDRLEGNSMEGVRTMCLWEKKKERYWENGENIKVLLVGTSGNNIIVFNIV